MDSRRRKKLWWLVISVKWIIVQETECASVVLAMIRVSADSASAVSIVLPSFIITLR